MRRTKLDGAMANPPTRNGISQISRSPKSLPTVFLLPHSHGYLPPSSDLLSISRSSLVMLVLPKGRPTSSARQVVYQVAQSRHWGTCVPSKRQYGLNRSRRLATDTTTALSLDRKTFGTRLKGIARLGVTQTSRILLCSVRWYHWDSSWLPQSWPDKREAAGAIWPLSLWYSSWLWPRIILSNVPGQAFEETNTLIMLPRITTQSYYR